MKCGGWLSNVVERRDTENLKNCSWKGTCHESLHHSGVFDRFCLVGADGHGSDLRTFQPWAEPEPWNDAQPWHESAPRNGSAPWKLYGHVSLGSQRCYRELGRVWDLPKSPDGGIRRRADSRGSAG